MATITIHTDGASRGNPGAAAIAYVIEGLAEGTIEHAQAIGSTTNNQAEYQALKAALTTLSQKELSVLSVECIADSELMVKQLNGQYRMKDTNLRPHFDEIKGLVDELERSGNSVIFTAVRRAGNKRADELCNLALDGKL